MEEKVVEQEYRCQQCRPVKEPVKIEITVKNGELVHCVLVHVDNHCHLLHVKLID